MADARKPQMIRNATGMNARGPGRMPMEDAQALAGGGDNVPAMVHDQSGNPQSPATIKEGEIIFSVEAVVGAGEGDYNAGAERLLQLHEQLKAMGEQAMQQGSLAAAPTPEEMQ
jgi:hypothetical protein